jgi:hypothetical protein
MNTNMGKYNNGGAMGVSYGSRSNMGGGIDPFNSDSHGGSMGSFGGSDNGNSIGSFKTERLPCSVRIKKKNQ